MNRGLEMRGLTLAEARSRIRSGEYAGPAGGIARGRVQTNLLVTGTVLAVLGVRTILLAFGITG
jgi:uncharacterized protein YcsI (UPF0317 family)